MKTAKQALRYARQIWGNDAAVQDYGPQSATTPEQRAAARAEFTAMKELLGSTKLGSSKATGADRRKLDDLLFKSMHHRYSVGVVVMGLFFRVQGSGDTWDDAFAAAEQRYPAKRAA